MPADQVNDDRINYKNEEVETVDFQRIWKEAVLEKKSHVIIVRDSGGGYFGLMAKQAVEVAAIPHIKRKKLPEEVISKENSFISGAVYMEDMNQWAYIADVDALLETEGR